MEIDPEHISKSQRKLYLIRRKFPSRTSCAREKAPDLPPVMLSSHLWRQSGAESGNAAVLHRPWLSSRNTIELVALFLRYVESFTPLSFQRLSISIRLCRENCLHQKELSAARTEQARFRRARRLRRNRHYLRCIFAAFLCQFVSCIESLVVDRYYRHYRIQEFSFI